MTYALNKLRQAVECLAQQDSTRGGLAAAIAQHLACIRIKDLPESCRAEFAALLDRICTGRIQEPNMSVRQMLDAFDDQEIAAMRTSIIRLHEAVSSAVVMTESTKAV